jgi:4-hydroxythreonine-4-phosphate dehydrogenase
MAAKNSPTRVGITSGDPNGIGIETVLKVFSDPRMLEEVTPILYATPQLVDAVAESIGRPEGLQWGAIAQPEQARPQQLNVLPFRAEDWAPAWGKVDPAAGQYAHASLERAVADLASNKTDVLVTAPIHKDAMRGGAFPFPGHTEYLAHVANVEEVLMLLVSDNLRVGVCTGHIALKDVSGALSSGLIRSKLQRMHEALLKDFGVPQPRIAVLGLNPHAGDNGLMGDEEKRIISPVIRELAAEGMQVMGPYAADGFFGSGAYRQFDGILAMFHDQGLAPFKALSFGSGVNFTAGLPIVRTSPDHGTGMDIAGKGLAQPDSMRAAIFLAKDVRNARRDYRSYSYNPLEINNNIRRESEFERRR